MNPTRRDFLTLIGLAGPTLAWRSDLLARLATLPGTASGSDERVLILLRLGGGNDGLNTVVPAEDDLYHRARPTLAIRKSAALELAGPHFLHPSLAGLKRLYDDGRLAVVNGVGYPAPDRSHFRSMDIWQSGQVREDAPSTGWIGRALAGTPRAGAAEEQRIPAIALLDSELPLALLGARQPVPSLPDLGALMIDDKGGGGALAAARPGASAALSFVTGAMQRAVAVAERIERIALEPVGGAFPSSRLGRSLATVARLVRARFGTRVYYTALDGFDTHTQQAQNHAALLRDLGDSVAALFAELARHGDHQRVALLTFSEFGRRVAENGSRGTDHGAAAPLFLASGAVQPGVIGPPPDLAALEDGDVAYHVDFRSVYATLLDDWLGADSRAVLGGAFPHLPLLA